MAMDNSHCPTPGQCHLLLPGKRLSEVLRNRRFCIQGKGSAPTTLPGRGGENTATPIVEIIKGLDFSLMDNLEKKNPHINPTPKLGWECVP